VCEASLHASYHVAKAGKVHTIAKTLIKQCIIDAAETMIGEKFSNIIKTMQLLNSTRRIHEMSTEIENEGTEHIKSSGH